VLFAAAIAGAMALHPIACTTFAGLTPEQTYLATPDDAARVCSLLFHCSEGTTTSSFDALTSVALSTGVPLTGSFSLCTTWLGGGVGANRLGLASQTSVFACLAGLDPKDCAGARACLSVVSLNDAGTECLDADGGDYCDGVNRTVDCHARRVYACDGARFPALSECLISANAHGACVLGLCDPGDASAADPPKTQCHEDDSATLCDLTGNLRLGAVCSSEGLFCADGGVTLCSADATCNSAPGTATCSSDASHVNACDGELTSTFDCSAINGTCSSDGQGHAFCRHASDGCSPFDADENVCEGTRVVACVAGNKTRFDCSTYGLTCTSGACR
jgi:hypothetical protein